jgi:hypothetical protein
VKPSSANSLKWQHARRARGLCVRCGGSPLITKNHCAICLQKIKKAQIEWLKSRRKTNIVYGAIRTYILEVAATKNMFTALDFPNLTVTQARSNLRGLDRDGHIICIRKSPPGNRYQLSVYKLKTP